MHKKYPETIRRLLRREQEENEFLQSHKRGAQKQQAGKESVRIEFWQRIFGIRMIDTQKAQKTLIDYILK